MAGIGDAWVEFSVPTPARVMVSSGRLWFREMDPASYVGLMRRHIDRTLRAERPSVSSVDSC
jgi:hypothetical protein